MKAYNSKATKASTDIEAMTAYRNIVRFNTHTHDYKHTYGDAHQSTWHKSIHAHILNVSTRI